MKTPFLVALHRLLPLNTLRRYYGTEVKRLERANFEKKMELVIESENEVLPYQFEPLKPSSDSSNDSDEESDEGILPHKEPGRPSSEWCKCDRCLNTSKQESVCCRDIKEVVKLLDDEGLNCVTEHEGFKVNCINRWSVQTSFWEFVSIDGPPLEETPMHESYRYAAYRRFSRFIWTRLPRKTRKVIPSCAVSAIREAFPSSKYCGFKYASMAD